MVRFRIHSFSFYLLSFVSVSIVMGLPKEKKEKENLFQADHSKTCKKHLILGDIFARMPSTKYDWERCDEKLHLCVGELVVE